MRFGKTLRNSIYPPWSKNYIDYNRLKGLLREHDVIGDDSDTDGSWTEQDEEAFVQELLNVQLDKVNAFQVQTSQQLRDRTAACEDKLRPLARTEEDGEDAAVADDSERVKIASEVLTELDDITKEVSELEKYSRINFTGFLKAAKKHDRKRGARYRVKPLLQVRLSQLPFNSEDYSPLVRRLSVMYSFVREILSTSTVEPEPGFGKDHYSSFKFWIHTDNLLEVKTLILRKLPVLIYNPKSSKELESHADDPTITSLYFDNPQFDLYTQKVARSQEAGSLRLRWTGNLNEKPPIYLEKKIVTSDDRSKEVKVQLKQKHVKEFLDGEYRLEKQVHRMEDMGNGETAHAESLKQDVEELQTFIKEHNLQPMLRANYTRTAFQIPGDDRIRISLDTNLALIREDSLDDQRPCRDANEWHRTDIDDPGMGFPFTAIRTGEIVRFPHGLLEIKLRGSAAHNSEWVKDLMVSHLVKEAPRFSKFVHGVAQLFEDHVNSFPFWLPELDKDIRRDPETAFHEEQERQAKHAEEDMAVGSFLGARSSPTARPLVGSPITRFTDLEPSPRPRQPSQFQTPRPTPSHHREHERESDREYQDEPALLARQEQEDQSVTQSRLAALFPSFTGYTRGKRSSVVLPPGVQEPGTWIKDAGPVRVETKVWLANQRTFIKWLHVSILLSSLSLGLYNAAGKHNDIARALSIVYTCFAIFAAAWGWYMHEMRARLIRQRSGRDLDNTFGPIVVCVGLAIALVLNFAFKYSSTIEKLRGNQPSDNPAIDQSLPMAGKPEIWNLVNQQQQAL
ncbi:VTC domain-containing protein [Aspergillus insuetus]